ncbi:unnamed protein product [Oreochromis niloticus]|nr:unnamed protein product [Mustela putorius furo]
MKILLLLLLISQHATAVEVYEGAESVLLPCQLLAAPSEFTAAVWDSNDLNIPTVHVRVKSGDDLDDQNQRYTNRTSMSADALQTGNFSLTLRNPTVSDSGTYTCILRIAGRDVSWTYLQPKVTEPPPPPPPVWPKVVSAVLAPVVVLAICCGIGTFCGYKRLKSKEVQEVEVDTGVTSAKLPCKATVQLSQINKVVWKNRNNRNVHVYENGSDHPEKQDRHYRHRTEMNKELLKTGDLSLTLKYPTHTARDTYTCTVYSSEGKVLMEKKVELKVKDCKLEVVEGAESVCLPFQTTENLPGDTEVLWKRHEPEYMKVHVYENGSDQPDKQDKHYKGRTEMKKDLLTSGDFSLTLKDPKVGDSGKYGCQVNNKEAWRYKRLWLTVTENNQAKKHTEDTRISSTDHLV